VRDDIRDEDWEPTDPNLAAPEQPARVEVRVRPMLPAVLAHLWRAFGTRIQAGHKPAWTRKNKPGGLARRRARHARVRRRMARESRRRNRG